MAWHAPFTYLTQHKSWQTHSPILALNINAMLWSALTCFVAKRAKHGPSRCSVSSCSPVLSPDEWNCIETSPWVTDWVLREEGWKAFGHRHTYFPKGPCKAKQLKPSVTVKRCLQKLNFLLWGKEITGEQQANTIKSILNPKSHRVQHFKKGKQVNGNKINRRGEHTETTEARLD